MTDILPSRLVLFDGICNLCNSSVGFVISHDPDARFYFASLQSDAGQRALKGFNLPAADLNSFIYIRDGVAYDRSTAALKLLKDLGGFWKITYVFMIIPRPFRDWVYDLIARSRYTLFGKMDSCMVPTPDLQNRFLV